MFLAIYQLYFSQFTNCSSHNLSTVCFTIYQLQCFEFSLTSVDCTVLNFLHWVFCRRKRRWRLADHLISPSAKSLLLLVYQLYFLKIPKCICQHWPTVFLHMVSIVVQIQKKKKKCVKLVISPQCHLTHLVGCRSLSWSADFPPGSNIWLFRDDKYRPPLTFVCHPTTR